MVLDLSCAHSNKLIIVILDQLPWLQPEGASFFHYISVYGAYHYCSTIFRWCDGLNAYTSCIFHVKLEEWKDWDRVSFFYYFHGFFLYLFIFYPACSDILPLLSRSSKPSKHIPSSYLQKCLRDLVSISPLVYTTSHFQRKRQLLEPTTCCSFKNSRLLALGCFGWDCVSQKRSHDFCIFVVLTQRR